MAGDRALGVDVAEAQKGLDVVVLDSDRRVIESVGRATAADVAALAALHEVAIVCIDSPSAWSVSGKSRAGERALAKLGIHAFSTPQDPGDHPFYRWMRAGFAVYEAVDPLYPLFRGPVARGTAAEVFPHATAVLLAGRHRGRDESKHTFRRGVVESAGIDTAGLRTIDRVDAALAALTGVLALDACFTSVGDPEEGAILLPAHSAGVEGPSTESR